VTGSLIIDRPSFNVAAITSLVQMISTRGGRGNGDRGKRPARGRQRNDPGVEQDLQDRTLFKKLLQGSGPIEHPGVNTAGALFERLQTVLQLVFQRRRDKRHRRELLLAQQSLHILPEHPAGVERQRPQAHQKDRQGEDRHPGLERPPLKDMRFLHVAESAVQ
jgi:hypothetical protein